MTMCLGAVTGGDARAQTVPVTLDPASQLWCRVLMAGSASPWISVPLDASLDIASPTPGGTGPVTVHNLRARVPSASCPVALSSMVSVSPAIASVVASTATGAGLTTDGSGASGVTYFGAGGLLVAFEGAADFSATGAACTALQSHATPCQGSFNLAAAGGAYGIISGGAIAPGPGSLRTVSLVFNASTPFATSVSWGSVEVWANLSGTFNPQLTPPACRPDFNNSGGAPTVADIFDFLAAWFARDPRTDFNGSGGIDVADIFAFLAAWFAGC